MTPLQGKLETIANQVGGLGVAVAILTFVIVVGKLFFETLRDPTKDFLSVSTINLVVNYLILSITVVVVAVPEGLPLAVTISLAYSVKKMRKENNLVRRLDASETMGGANEVCTDKTGTLTKNQMTVQEIYINEQVVKGRVRGLTVDQYGSADLFVQGVLWNCSARIEKNHSTGVLEPKGNCTEIGLIKYLMSAGIAVQDIIRAKEGKILQTIPFNSRRKRASTVLSLNAKDSMVRVFLKGAPEIVIDYCTSYYDASGTQQELTEETKNKILSDIVTATFAKKAYRTLMICAKDISLQDYEKLKAENNNFKGE